MIQFLPISWSTYHKTVQKLAATILDSSTPYDEIVAISRGGLTLGHLLSDMLRIPVATITIQSYTDIQAQGELVITEKLSKPIRDKRILLVDDVSDSGKTLNRAIAYLKRFGPSNVTTVTMFFKPQSVHRPDYFADTTTKWIIFPYEPTETILTLTKNMEKEKKTKAQIQEFLESLGFTTDQITFVRRHHVKNP